MGLASDATSAGLSSAGEAVSLEAIKYGSKLKSLLVNEGGVAPARLVSVLHYDGSPISARFIIKDITEKLQAAQAALRENAE